MLLILMLAACNLYAQPEDKSRVALTAAFGTNNHNDFCYQTELSYHYMRHPYLGFGGAIGACGVLNDHMPNGYANNGIWTSWHLNKEYQYINQLYLRPSILFRTPALVEFKNNYSLHFQFEPGVQLLIPYSSVRIDFVDGEAYEDYSERISSSKGNWCFWNLKSGLFLNNNDIIFGIGYIITNLDVYSTRRNMSVENTSLGEFYPKTKLTHYGFIYFGMPF